MRRVNDGGEQSASSQSPELEDQFDIAQSFTVETSQSFGFEDMNGSQHEFSNGQGVTVDVNAHALVGVATDTTQGLATGNGFEE